MYAQLSSEKSCWPHSSERQPENVLGCHHQMGFPSGARDVRGPAYLPRHGVKNQNYPAPRTISSRHVQSRGHVRPSGGELSRSHAILKLNSRLATSAAEATERGFAVAESVYRNVCGVIRAEMGSRMHKKTRLTNIHGGWEEKTDNVGLAMRARALASRGILLIYVVPRTNEGKNHVPYFRSSTHHGRRANGALVMMVLSKAYWS